MQTAPCIAMSSTTITLRYPLQWYTPVHPQAEAAEEGTQAWLNAMRLLDSPTVAAKFRHLGVARYGGWPLYHADAEALATVTRFLTLWIFYDDMLEGVGEDKEAMAVAAIGGDPEFDREAATPYLQAFWDNAQRYRARMSERWSHRFAKRFGGWLHSVRQEAEMMATLRAGGGHPSVPVYVACRRDSIGVLPTLLLVEYCCGEPLPEALQDHPVLAALERATCDMVLVQNDLVSIAKDARDGGLNLAFSLAARGIDLVAACRELERTHDLALKLFMSAAEFLRQEFSDCPALHRWLGAVETMCHGFARWHLSNTRYDRGLELGDGTSIHIEVEYV
jgi:hypothetical protein